MCFRILALIVRHTNRIFSAPHYIFICAQSGSTIYFHNNPQKAQFSRKKLNTKFVLWVFLQFLYETFCLLIRIQREIVQALVKVLIKLEFSPQICDKSSSTEFHENPCSGSRVVPCGGTDMLQLIVSFLNVQNAPKMPTTIHTFWPEEILSRLSS